MEEPKSEERVLLGANRSIMLIEDAPQIAKILVMKLEREGYRVSWCMDGKEGFDAMVKALPDLAIIDASLKGRGDGLMWVHAMRQQSLLAQVPVMVMLEQEERGDAHLAQSAGAQHIIQKPFKPTVVARQIHVMFGVPLPLE